MIGALDPLPQLRRVDVPDILPIQEFTWLHGV